MFFDVVRYALHVARAAWRRAALWQSKVFKVKYRMADRSKSLGAQISEKCAWKL